MSFWDAYTLAMFMPLLAEPPFSLGVTATMSVAAGLIVPTILES